MYEHSGSVCRSKHLNGKPTTVDPTLLLKYQDQHQSVSYHDVPASDLVNQNYSDISIPPVPESEVQTAY